MAAPVQKVGWPFFLAMGLGFSVGGGVGRGVALELSGGSRAIGVLGGAIGAGLVALLVAKILSKVLAKKDAAPPSPP